MSKTFAPMLAAAADLTTLRYPVYGSPKLDGIRAVSLEGRLLSRKLIDIPNQYLRDRLVKAHHEGLDGELVVGPPTAKDVFRKTTSGVMSVEGKPDFTWYVFDIVNAATFGKRLEALRQRNLGPNVQVLEQRLLNNAAELDAFESMCVAEGYEGVILRDPDGFYKYGRSTPREGGMLKVKRFEDSEALVIEVIEEMHNANEAGQDNLGRTKRSSHKAGKVGKEMMGALKVRDLKSGVVFNVGTGFTTGERMYWWMHQKKLVDKAIIKYQFFPVGVKDLPRHPRFAGIRDARDL